MAGQAISSKACIAGQALRGKALNAEAIWVRLTVQAVMTMHIEAELCRQKH